VERGAAGALAVSVFEFPPMVEISTGYADVTLAVGEGALSLE
jgi:hypothetical protein